MRFWFTSILVFLALSLAVETASGQQPRLVSASAQQAGSTPVLQYFSNSRPYAWDQVFYGPPPRPRKLSKIEKQARHTSEVLARGLGHAAFEDEAFGEVLEGFFLGRHELAIKVDWDALAASSGRVTRDSKVNIELGHATVEDVLEDVLDQLSEQAQAEEDILTFYVFEGKVKVATRGAFSKLIVTRIYNISFIGRGTPHYIDAPELGINRLIPFDLAEPPPNLNLPPQAGTSRNPRRNFQELREQLIDMLKDFRPDTWKEHGGRGTISIMGNELMIRQTCEMHELIGGKWW